MRSYKLLLSAALCAYAASGDAAVPNLVAFVGEKISVEQFEPEGCENCIRMDGAFRARYRVLQVVYGTLPLEEVTFVAYDHYGTPMFSKHEHALLFISKGDDGGFYHQKYQYFPVYRTTDGRWFGCGSPYQDEPEVHRHMTVHAEDVEFAKPVHFSLKGLKDHEVKERYPAEFFTYARDRAYCNKGASVDGLFQVKRDGVLRARGVFDE